MKQPCRNPPRRNSAGIHVESACPSPERFTPILSCCRLRDSADQSIGKISRRFKTEGRRKSTTKAPNTYILFLGDLLKSLSAHPR